MNRIGTPRSLPHLHEMAAFRRDLDAPARGMAEDLWIVFGELKSLIAGLAAAGTLVVAGQSRPDAWLLVVRSAASRLVSIEADLADMTLSDPCARDLRSAVRTLRRSLSTAERRLPYDAPAVWRSLVDVYRSGRALSSTLWALELRPEGLPLTFAAREFYEEGFRRSRPKRTG